MREGDKVVRLKKNNTYNVIDIDGDIVTCNYYIGNEYKEATFNKSELYVIKETDGGFKTMP